MTIRRQRLAGRRRSIGLTQEELASRLTVDPATVRRWEAGRSTPRPWVRPRLAALLKLEVADLDLILEEAPARGRYDAPRSHGPTEIGLPVAEDRVAGATDLFLEVAPDRMDDLVSIPIEHAEGVVAYVVTRRTLLTSLTPALPFLSQVLRDGTEGTGAQASGDGTFFDLAAGIDDHLDLDSQAKVTRMLASQRQSVAPGVLLRLVNAHSDSLSAVWRRPDSASKRKEIGAVLGETWIVSSRLWSAVGNRTQALAACAGARRLADRIGDAPLGVTARIFESNILSDAATLIGEGGDLPLSLRMLGEAAEQGMSMPPAARARIAAEQAQILAALELEKECQEALRVARTAVAEIGNSENGLFGDWSPERLHVYEGTCNLLLGRHAEAIEILTDAVEQLASQADTQNVRLAAQVDLARAHAETGDLVVACEMLATTFEQLCASGNDRGIQRAYRVRSRVARRWHDEPMLIELNEQMDAARDAFARGI